MASYLNRKNERVHVSDEHIETAIEIKQELQKNSPSHRTNWSVHKKMMEQEGYDDSSTNENYRQLVKNEQRKRGQLPEVPKYADMVSDKKLSSIKEAIGEMYTAKRGNQNATRELNKIKRQLADDLLFFDEVKEQIGLIDLSSLRPDRLKPVEETDNAMLVNASDWHIGLVTENYNYEIANEKVKKYAEEVIKYSKVFNIGTVYVQNLGDSVEGTSMRPTQLFDVEFDYSTQVVKATEIMFKFLLMLSQELNVVYLGGIYGNHSRFHDKAISLPQDSSENIIDASLKSFISLADNPRLKVDDRKENNAEISFTINGRNVKAVHGDKISKNGDKLSKIMNVDNKSYDLLLFGHYHHASLMERSHGRLEVGVGCLPESTDFSKSLGHNTNPSQTIVVFEGERMIPIRIEL